VSPLDRGFLGVKDLATTAQIIALKCRVQCGCRSAPMDKDLKTQIEAVSEPAPVDKLTASKVIISSLN
jgi:hypothetical protein